MEKIFLVKITIKSIQQSGICTRGHKPGDTFIFDGDAFFPEICPDALYTVYPWLQVFRYGGYNPWGDKTDGSTKKIELCCPDPKNPVVFEISQID